MLTSEILVILLCCKYIIVLEKNCLQHFTESIQNIISDTDYILYILNVLNILKVLNYYLQFFYSLPIILLSIIIILFFIFKLYL